ncbi:hypothetical protein IWW36_000443 [Coemansia brasiliensis]|uniref:COP9 signalosome complex subunit 6 n=1 Tax=Coemansia brasiliensis TaxID=2650707 RepID=A0A9W8IAY7_9FUNG|nr:hypothetical protein IWW36_000443 [Coemansia brasiliensis]
MSQTLSTVVIHPLVLLNISEQTTRTVAQVKRGKAAVPPSSLICGALLGQQSESKLEAFLTFEFKLNSTDNGAEVDLGHFTARLEQLKQIFPSDELIGWYVVGTSMQVTSQIAQLHEQIIRSYPLALLMIFDAALADGSVNADGNYSLPIVVYETRPPVRKDQAKLQWYKDANAMVLDEEYFVECCSMESVPLEPHMAWASQLVPLKVAIDSGEAERVAVEHVANISQPTSDDMLEATLSAAHSEGSRIGTFLSSQRNALEMLYRDILLLKTYVKDVMDKKAPFDPDVLQRVQRVLSNMPVVRNDQLFDLAMSQEETNYQLTMYLAGITNAVAAVRDVSQKSNVALSSARARHAPYVSPNQGDSMFGMMPPFGSSGRMGRHRGFPGFH